jgi:hypothetical protein
MHEWSGQLGFYCTALAGMRRDGACDAPECCTAWKAGDGGQINKGAREISWFALRRNMKEIKVCTRVVQLFPAPLARTDTQTKLTPEEYVCFYRNTLSLCKQNGVHLIVREINTPCQYKLGELVI